MHPSRFFFAAAVLSLLCSGNLQAWADEAPAADSFFDELRVGVYAHDISFLGHKKESGNDAGLELLFKSPALLDPIGAPRPIIGFLANSVGETNQLYSGLTWNWDFLRDILNPGDGLYVEGTLSAALHDGELDVTDPVQALKRKSLGFPLLFREDVDFGYHITPQLSVAVSFNHISDADLAKRNEGLNDLGVRLGWKF